MNEILILIWTAFFLNCNYNDKICNKNASIKASKTLKRINGIPVSEKTKLRILKENLILKIKKEKK